MTAMILADALPAAICAILAYLALVAITLCLAGGRWALSILLACAAFIFLLAEAALATSVGSDTAWRFAAFYACGVAMTIFVYGAVLKSLSLQMLAVMASKPNGVSNVDQLTASVIAPQLEERIALLENSGLIEAKPNGYVVADRGRTFVSRLARVHAFLRIDSNGLYSG